jgi:uncharacterized protein with LGFP repeats
LEAVEGRQLLSGAPLPVPSHQSILQLDPIQVKYWSLGGPNGILGDSVSGEMATPFNGSTYEKFQNGTIFYSPATGVHDVLLPTENEFFAAGNETDAFGNNVEKLLGLPTTDQAGFLGVPGDAVTSFQSGAIYASPATGAHVLYGAIGGEYAATASETDAFGKNVQTLLGLPTSDEANDPYVSGARMETFQGGAIYWSSATGAHVLYGAIGAEYAATANQTDAVGRNVQTLLGLPTSDEMNVPGISGARMNTFQGGSIDWSLSTGAHDLYGQIWGEYLATASEKDYYGTNVQQILGLPTSDETNVPGVTGARMETFQGGSVYWSSPTGAHAVYGAIGGRYNSGGGAGVLGLPTADEAPTPDGSGRFVHFAGQNGAVSAIDWTPWTGAHAVTGAIASKFAAQGWEKMGEAVTDEIDIESFGYYGAYNRFQTMTPIAGSGIPSVVTSRSAIDYTQATGAYVTHGPQYTDIQQGDAGTCWIDASIAAVESRGTDLSQQIQYEGHNEYAVSLYSYNDPKNPSAGLHPITEQVEFDGTTFGADLHWNPADPAQSWALIMQRAVLLAVGNSYQNPIGGGDPINALPVLTGQLAQTFGPGDPNLIQELQSALNSGKAVTLVTKGTTTTLVASHCYDVLSVDGTGITLYNPWGSAVTVSWWSIAGDVFAYRYC